MDNRRIVEKGFDEKKIMIEGTFLIIIAILVIILFVKTEIIDKEYSSDITIYKIEGSTIDDIIKNDEYYFVDIERQKVVKTRYESNPRIEGMNYKVLSRKKLTEDDINKIVNLCEEPPEFIIKVDEGKKGFDYSDIGYRLTYQGENIWIYKKDSKVIDDLISNMK